MTEQVVPKGWHAVPSGHRPLIRPRVEPVADRCPEDVLQRFRIAALEDVADAVGPLYVMDSGMYSLYQPVPRLVGQALTVKSPPGDNLTIWGAESMVQPGDVLVIDWKGFTGCGAGGGGSLVPPILEGLAGVLIDGAWRDVDEVQAMQIPLFGRAVHPSSPQKAQVGEINVPVNCGGAVVEPGDVIVADAGGIVVVPSREVGRVADSLAEYSTPQSIDDWPVDARRRKSADRTEQFWAVFNQQSES